MHTGLVAAVFSVLLASCLTTPTESDKDGLSQAIQDTPRYQQAKTFDSLLKKTLTAEEKRSLIQQCHKNAEENIFCFAILRERKLRDFLDAVDKSPRLRQKPQPITVEIHKGRVKHWNQTQKANLRGLLAGMRTFSLEELKIIGAYALKRPECPNNVAVSAAALMEIHLAFENVAPEIARLYEKGARCTRRGTPNHEHYLTRAALFWFLERKFEATEKLLARIAPTDAYSGRSLYWLYRTQTLLGKTAVARRTLNRLQSQHPMSFHALLVQAQQKGDPLEASSTSIPTRSQRLDANTVIEEAETLVQTGFTEASEKLVDWALVAHSPPEPGVRAYLSTLGGAATQIRTLQTLLLTRPALRNQAYYQLAYPKSYFDLFSEFKAKVDPYLLLAIARKESTLDPKAVSPANAQGLLQLNPETAKRFSNKETLDLFDPRTNTEIAAAYMQELKEMMRGQLPLMIASYNAGENTVASWTQRYPTTDLLLFLDLIPYRETRDYVGYVLSNYFWYRRLYADNPQAALLALSGAELAKLEEPRGVRSIKSIAEEALKTSESWPDDPPAARSFLRRWRELDSGETPF